MGNGKRTGAHRNNRLADMTLPADERSPRKGTRTSRKPKPAQLQHGNNTWGRARRREGERAMERERSDGSAVLEEPLEPEDPRL